MTSKLFSKTLRTNLNIPLALAISLVPDIDLLLEPALIHGGPTHSILLLTILFIPAFFIWKKASLPYLASAASHSIIGDYLTRLPKHRGVQLLYPLNSTFYSARPEVTQLTYIYSEIIMFVAFLFLLVAARDTKALTKVHPSNFLFIIPILTAALPVFIEFPLPVPSQLIIPHLALMVILAVPILLDLESYIRKAISPQA